MAEVTSKMVPIPSKGVDYRGKLVLAPMVRTGEMPLRLLALHYGADLVWGPETVDYSLIGTTRVVNPTTKTVDFIRNPSYAHRHTPVNARESIIYRLHPELEGRKHIFQIGTANPERAVTAARIIAADVAGIDVNAGCPKPFSTHDGMGAALLKTPDKLVSILEALVKEIVPEFQIGISVKIRILETAAETEALVRRLVATGITALTVHCRTTPMRPREKAIRGQLKMVADICREAGVACLMNGDVEDRDSAKKLVEEFGVDGAMIATAAEKNPSCFRSQADGGLAPWQEVVSKYMEYTMDSENKYGNTKYVLSRLVPGKKPAYQLLQTCKSYSAVCDTLGLDDFTERAKAADIAVGITKDPNPQAKLQPTATTTTATATASTTMTTTASIEKRKSDDTQEVTSSAKRQRVVEEQTAQGITEIEPVQPAVALSA
ncbi:hypothetical protein BD289DRAFT_452378 [Coniella lustricola]|uniref:DUS-like FMN-binding domain-containing protein n=1 Tax=Coniella lustricola TaxID=2025994 RepID=A0A2T3ABH4_9PEZI|nr:hypothetical protein BD289DRAFT_452378 [Coniella lustricola]